MENSSHITITFFDRVYTVSGWKATLIILSMVLSPFALILTNL
jgi:hypothetical protein